MAVKINNSKTFVKKKPQESCRDFIAKLKKGLAYTLDELSDQWGIRPNTIRDHAKQMDCYRWMKDEEGNWSEVVLNPDTAKDVDKQTP